MDRASLAVSGARRASDLGGGGGLAPLTFGRVITQHGPRRAAETLPLQVRAERDPEDSSSPETGTGESTRAYTRPSGLDPGPDGLGREGALKPQAGIPCGRG